MPVKAKTRKREVSPKEYRDFIKGIDLEDIFFTKASFEILVPKMPKVEGIDVDIKDHAELLRGSQKDFLIKHKYNLVCVNPKNKKEKYIKISADLVVQYSSKEQITDNIFELFKKVNLPVNTWPYFREYVHSSISRLNLPPLVLPALKRP